MAGNLPLQLTSFIGRQGHIADVADLLRADRLVTLTGAGGVGKTRLAIEIGVRSRDAYPDGVWLVELAPLADPALVPRAVTGALGVIEETARPILESLINYIRARRLLILLDNCEHVVAACAALAERLLQTCPELRVMATSREALNLPGEVVWLVPSLSVPSAELHGWSGASIHGTSGLLDFEAVRLFVDRARAASADFTFGDSNATAVAQACRRLDGIPLALELAAARVRALTVEQIASRLDDRFRLLSAGGRTAVPRHQTLRAMVDWSYALLSDGERALLRRLSVFAGGWTLGAAERVCMGDGIKDHEVLGLLSQLVDRSLVVAEPRGHEKRYRLLETLREYGAERLRESGEEVALRDRHLAWFLALAVQADPEFYRAGQAAWYDRLETEIDNVRAGLEWSKTEATRLGVGLRLAGALWRFWYTRGHLTEGWERLVALLGLSATGVVAEADRPAHMAARAIALDAAGRLGAYRDDLVAADQFLREGLALHRAAGDVAGTAISLRNLGIVTMYRGELAEAQGFLEESVALMRELGDASLTHTPLLHLGWAAYFQGHYERAQSLWDEGVALAEAYGDVFTQGNILTGLGQLALRRGDLTAARAHLEGDLRLRLETRDAGGTCEAIEVLACVAAAEGKPERAMRLAGAAAALRTASARTIPQARVIEREARLEPARRALSVETAAAAWAEGATMSLEQAIAYALEPAAEAARASPARAHKGLPTDPLTPREREVAILLARGLTNREIAAELVIAEGTAGIHVDHILAKLGFHSRAQVAAWVAERGLHTEA